MKKIPVSVFLILFITFSQSAFAHSKFSIEIPNKASVNGKYSNLIQIIQCRKDRATYGAFNEYGYWRGGSWCGLRGKGGYWVWVSPNWYVWQEKE